MELCRDEKGNALLAVEPLEEAKLEAVNFTHCLAVVRVGDDYLLGWNNWRGRFEIFGGGREAGESPRECIRRECEEELGIRDVEIQYLGAMKFWLTPDYFSKEERIEYGGLYGISLPQTDLDALTAQIRDRDEILRLGFYRQIKGREPIAVIDEKLLEFFP